MSDATISGVFPFLTYRDPAKAIDWLQEAFGFRTLNVTRAPDGSVVHAELLTQQGVVLMTPAQGGGVLPMRSPLDLGFSSQGVFVRLAGDEDVDKHHAQAVAAGATVLLELSDKPWGSREYTCADHEGHVWSFGTYAPSAG